MFDAADTIFFGFLALCAAAFISLLVWALVFADSVPESDVLSQQAVDFGGLRGVVPQGGQTRAEVGP